MFIFILMFLKFYCLPSSFWNPPLIFFHLCLFFRLLSISCHIIILVTVSIFFFVLFCFSFSSLFFLVCPSLVQFFSPTRSFTSSISSFCYFLFFFYSRSKVKRLCSTFVVFFPVLWSSFFVSSLSSLVFLKSLYISYDNMWYSDSWTCLGKSVHSQPFSSLVPQCLVSYHKFIWAKSHGSNDSDGRQQFCDAVWPKVESGKTKLGSVWVKGGKRKM